MTDAKMTRAERSELGSLIRKRERVMKAAARERSAVLMAEFDAASAQIYKIDGDDVWKKVTLAAQSAIVDADRQVKERCRELGIPEQFRPSLSMNWYGRGENAVGERRAELRQKAKSKVEAMELEAVTKIERLSLTAQTEIITSGLESSAAREFLDRLSTVEALMPAIDIQEIKMLIDARTQREADSYD